MKNRFFFLALLLCGLLLVSVSADAQCSICTRTAQQLGDKPAKSLNLGILYLAATPLLIAGFVGYRWWKKNEEIWFNLSFLIQKVVPTCASKNFFVGAVLVFFPGQVQCSKTPLLCFCGLLQHSGETRASLPARLQTCNAAGVWKTNVFYVHWFG